MKKLIIFLFITVTLSAFAQVPDYVPTNGLVGWWPFNGNANDASGNGNNGTVNGATLTTDRFGNANSAYNFDGNDDIITTNIDSEVEGLSQMTLSAWFKWDGIFPSSGVAKVIRKPAGFGINTNRWQLCINNYGSDPWENENIQLFMNDNSWDNIGYFDPAVVDSLYHIVFVFNGNGTNNSEKITMYVNGNNVSLNYTNTIPIVTPSNNFPIDFGSSFAGIIDDIGIWNRALTSCEIADLYNAQVGSLNSTSTTTVSNCESYTWNNQTYTQSGQYTFETTNAAGCDSTATLNLTITQPTSGSETVTECNSFTWGANNQTYTATGQYSAVLTNAVGCDSTATLILTITQPSSGAETVTACDAYTWSANNQTYNQSGQYSTVLTNAAGCDSTATLNLSINTVDNGITQIDDISLQATANNVQYQWVDCSDNYQTISGETSQSFEATVNGSYAVIVTQNGCSDTTACITISKVGLENLNASLFTVYPNPAQTLITIQSEVSLNTKYTILDAQGRHVLNGKLEGLKVSVDIEHLANGLYTIQFEQAELKEINFIKE